MAKCGEMCVRASYATKSTMRGRGERSHLGRVVKADRVPVIARLLEEYGELWEEKHHGGQQDREHEEHHREEHQRDAVVDTLLVVAKVVVERADHDSHDKVRADTHTRERGVAHLWEGEGEEGGEEEGGEEEGEAEESSEEEAEAEGGEAEGGEGFGGGG